MTATVLAASSVTIERGPRLLDPTGPITVAELRAAYADPARTTLSTLVAVATQVGLSGRGGAGFPFVEKVRTVAASGRRPVVVVNIAEGEPASAKDSVLALRRPHLVLAGQSSAVCDATRSRRRSARAADRSLGREPEWGTTLLTVHDRPGGRVVEVALGRPWARVLDARTLARPILVGGYHGTWLAPGALADRTVSRRDVAAAGGTLGAGIVLPLAQDDCPLAMTARVLAYLAGESAGRCGPCRFGLPALADAFETALAGRGPVSRVADLVARVTGRGACAHPDGTARLAASALAVFGPEIAQHAAGGCTLGRCAS